MAMNKYKIPNGGQKRTLLDGPKERKARKACQKAMLVFRRVVLALTSPTKVQARIFTQNKGRGRIKKEKAKNEPSFNLDCQPQKHPMKKDMAAPKNQTIGLPVIGLTIPGLQMLGGSAQRLILHGWWQLGSTRSIGSRSAIERFQRHTSYLGMTTEFCRCNKFFVFANFGKETCVENCLIHFPTTPPCSTKEVDVLRQVMCPSCFPSLT